MRRTAMVAIISVLAAACVNVSGPSSGPWTQEQASAADKAVHSIEGRICILPVWEMSRLLHSPTAHVEKRDQFATSVATVVDRLVEEQRREGGRLLEPDLGLLVAALDARRAKLLSPMTEDEFQEIREDLRAAHSVICEFGTWKIDGRNVSLHYRAYQIQDWVNKNVKR